MSSWSSGAPRVGTSLTQKQLNSVRPSNGTNLANYFSERTTMRKKFEVANQEEIKAKNASVKKQQEADKQAEKYAANLKLKEKKADLKKLIVLYTDMLVENISEARKAWYRTEIKSVKQELENL
jgi:hypothetical protein